MNGITPKAFRSRLARSSEAGAAVGFLAVFIFFATMAPDTFLSHASISSILNSQAVPGIVAIGITVLMISGEFDLSVGSVLGVSSLAFLYAAVSGIHILLAAFLGLATGCFLGLVNGLIFVSTGIPSFIVTLGTMLVYRAISLTAVSGGRIIRYADYSRQDPILAVPASILTVAAIALFALVLWMSAGAIGVRLNRLHHAASPSDRLRSAASLVPLLIPAGLAATLSLAALYTLAEGLNAPIEIGFFSLLNGRPGGDLLPGNYRTAIVWWLALSLLFAVILTCTRYGNAVFATGGNADAARAQGIGISRVRILNFVLSGGLAALAGIIQVARLKSVDPLRGAGLELEVIAAVVIGGTLLTGGFGSVIGSAVGTALTGMLRTGLVLISVPTNAFRGAIGAIMIAAVIINTLVRRER